MNVSAEKKLGTEENSSDREKTEKDSKKGENISYFKLYKYASPLDSLLITIGITSALICGALQAAIYALFGVVTGHIVEFVSKSTNATSTKMLDRMIDSLNGHILWYVISACSVCFSLALFTYIANVSMTYAAARQITSIRKLFLRKMLDKEIECNISKIEDGIGEKVVMFSYYISVFVCGSIMSLYLGWQLALTCLTSLPVNGIIMGIISWLSAILTKEEMEAYASAGAIAEEALSAIKTVVAFEGQKKEVETYKEHLKIAKMNNIKRHCVNGLSNGIMWFLVYGAYAVSLGYGVDLIIRERELPPNERIYTPGSVMTIFTCTIFGSYAFLQATPFLETFGIAKGAATGIFSILESKTTIDKSKSSGLKFSKIEGDIRFENVYFEYPSRPEVKVLKGITLNVKKGETIGLVGSSGCGKSSCIQLIQRLYDPTGGNIYIDGKNIREFNIPWLREHIGVVNQEPVLFDTTIRENILFGKPDATEAEIENSLKLANAHRFVMKLPQGYETVVGARGVQLSGGQKQRLAIARALVREPSILLLDEATSELDTVCEAEVQNALNKLTGTRTILIVAHRLSTIRNADRILYFEDNKVVERNKNLEPMECKGEENARIILDDRPDVYAKNDEGENGSKHEVKTSLDAERDKEVNEDKIVGKCCMLKLLRDNLPGMHYILLGCISSIIIGASAPIYAMVFGEIIGVLANDDEIYILDESYRLCVYFVIIGIVVGLAYLLQIYSIGVAGEFFTFTIRNKMFSSMLNQEIGWFDVKENRVGTLCTRLAMDASCIQAAAGMRIGTIFNALSASVLTIFLGFYLKWDLTLVLLVFAIAIVFCVWYEQKVLTKDAELLDETLERSTKIALEAVGNIRTVASLSAEMVFHDKYVEALELYVKNVNGRIHFRSLIVAAVRCLPILSYISGIAYGAKLIVQEHMYYGNIYKIVECIISISWSIGMAVTFSTNFHSAVSTAERIFKLIHRVSKIRNEAISLVKQWNNGNIKYSDVHFSYPTRPDAQVLNGLNLTILQGKTVALVGSSGCGKSTIMKLMERFYDPTSGKILIDDDDIKSVNLGSLRARLGIVSQEPNLFDRSIADNIAYGANNRNVSMEEIIEAATKANIHRFVSSLPLGYETRLGSKGTQLSGGQKQRIAIARALIREPQVLLLDEATSALDKESEKVVMTALDVARTGKTCITIAHRLTTIQDADLICVIKNGVIAKSGKHHELMSKEGEYYRFYKLHSGET